MTAVEVSPSNVPALAGKANLLQRIASQIERGREMPALAVAEAILDIVNDVPWTLDEKESGARAVVEKLRLDQRNMAAGAAGGKNGQIIQKPYAPMSDKEWRDFRNVPVCAQAIMNVHTIFRVLKRVGNSARL